MLNSTIVAVAIATALAILVVACGLDDKPPAREQATSEPDTAVLSAPQVVPTPEQSYTTGPVATSAAIATPKTAATPVSPLPSVSQIF